MKKGIILLVLFSSTFRAQTNYDYFKDYSAVYVPDENITYFADKIGIKKIEGGEEIIMTGIVGKLNGDYSTIILENNPNMKPIVRWNMRRKEVKSSIGNYYSVTCVYNGFLCVILFPKKFIDEE
jgi:hypothetical protein